ncbi:MAG: prolyl oligopeptidase family serine peptidase [Planctomycetales bacterium]|nr:prolyl oligopeptidase family serine peptidase [Planctomycetales bacterium]
MNIKLQIVSVVCGVLLISVASAQDADLSIPDEDRSGLQNELAHLTSRLAAHAGEQHIADAAVCQKAVEWILRHDEFYSKSYVSQTLSAIELGNRRLESLRRGDAPWVHQIGMTVRGYRSDVDDSIQPYAVTLPVGYQQNSDRKWPLHVVLHGRAGRMNEVNFIHKYNDIPVSEENTGWIQLDVFGRTNNAYRWSGETDVFEALAQVIDLYEIDEERIVLRGFSMGGAGAWHLGMHFPGKWCSVGPGAGFVDFYEYQKQTQMLPAHQHATLGIYDSIDYALNAFNVPTCTYGGEIDPQLAAGKSMYEKAKLLGVPVELIVGPGMGHKFDSESRKTFFFFHRKAMDRGRTSGESRKEIRFTTRTLRYNRCDWIAVLEQEQVYAPSTVSAKQDDDAVTIDTENVAALSLHVPFNERKLIVDGQSVTATGGGELIIQRRGNAWTQVDGKSFRENRDLRKRHGLQGPIDDAFVDRFVCVNGHGSPWSKTQQHYSEFVLRRFSKEYSKWLRAKLPIHTSDEHVSMSKLVAQNPASNVVLFGDPGSNQTIADVLDKLPIKWTKESIVVDGKQYSTRDHALSMVFPNPNNPRRYVVINSGHTIHDADFQASNAWLFPRLGDIAIQKVTPDGDSEFKEETVWAANFDSNWALQPNN